MLGRRTFLSLLGMAPAAPRLFEEAAKQTSTVAINVSSEAGPSPMADQAWYDQCNSPEWKALNRAIEDKEHTNHQFVGVYPRFEEMKSWSRVFKVSESAKEETRRRTINNQIHNILYDEQTSVAEKTVKLALLGIKPCI